LFRAVRQNLLPFLSQRLSQQLTLLDLVFSHVQPLSPRIFMSLSCTQGFLVRLLQFSKLVVVHGAPSPSSSVAFAVVQISKLDRLLASNAECNVQCRRLASWSAASAVGTGARRRKKDERKQRPHIKRGAGHKMSILRACCNLEPKSTHAELELALRVCLALVTALLTLQLPASAWAHCTSSDEFRLR